jgi:SAM-dependent methyltransferase
MSGSLHKHYYEQYWNAGFSDWLPTGVAIKPFEKEFLANSIPRNSRVLDFGCGDGSHAAPFLVSHGCSYSGVDISSSAVALSRGRGFDATQYSPDSRLPFADQSFDAAVSFEVFEHLFDPLTSVRDIHRVLRPGGCLVGSVPNSVHLGNRLLMALGRFSPGGSPATSLLAPWNDPHIRFFNKRTLMSFLQQAGFQNCKVVGRDLSLSDFPALYKSVATVRQFLLACSRPLAPFGRWWPAACSATLYFAARK